MATFVDIGIFEGLAGVFTFLLIFVIIYAFLSAQRVIKVGGSGEKGIYALIAVSLALLSVLSGVAVSFIAILTPWFTVFIIFLFFIFFIFKMWAGDDDNFFREALKNNKGIQWTLIVVAILILITALSGTFGQQLLEGNPELEGTQQQEAITQDGVAVVQVDSAGQSTGQRPSTDGRVYSNDQQVTNSQTSTATGSFSDNVLATLTHPKILGLILIMLISFFCILFLARNNDPNV